MSGAWEGRVALPPSPSWYGACLGDWDPAGRRFAYVAGGTLVVLQPGERRVAACLVPPRRGRYTAVQFLPGRGLGSLLVAARAGSHASPAEVHLWDALSGDLLRRVRLPKVPPPSASWAALGVHRGRPGEVLCAGAAGVVALVNVAGAAQAADMAAMSAPVSCLAWRDGAWAVAGLESGRLAVLRVPPSPGGTPVLEEEKEAHGRDVQSLSWSSPRRRLLSAGRDRLVKVWDFAGDEGGALVLRLVASLRLPGSGGAAPNLARTWVSAAWVPHLGGVVASLEGGDFVAWKVGGSDNDVVRLRSGHTRPVFLLAPRPGRAGDAPLLASLSMDRQVRFASCAAGKLALAWALPGLGALPYCVAPSPFLPGAVACGGGDGCVRVWSLDGGRPPVVLWHGLSGERVRAVEWSPAEDGVLAYGTEKGAVGCVRLTSGGAGRVGGGHEKGPVHSLTWLFDGAKVLSCGGDGRALLFEPLEGSRAEGSRAEPSELEFAAKAALCAEWAPEAQLLASGHACGAVLLSRVTSGSSVAEAVVRLLPHPPPGSGGGPVSALSWGVASERDGRRAPRLASVAAGGSVAISAASSSSSSSSPSWVVQWQSALPPPRKRTGALAFSPDGRSLAAGGAGGAWVLSEGVWKRVRLREQGVLGMTWVGADRLVVAHEGQAVEEFFRSSGVY